MHQPRFLARGLLVSFLLIALLAAPGALTFTWAGAAAVNQAGTNTPTATGTSSEPATATSTVAPLGKFTGLQAAPLAACSGTTVAQWNFDDNSITPTAGSGNLVWQPSIVGPNFPPGNPGPSLGFTNWPTLASRDLARYLELDLSTQGRDQSRLAFDYNSEPGGPTKLDLYYSATVPANYLPAFTWDLVPAGGWTTASTYVFGPTISIVDNNPNVSFRLYAYGATDSSKMLSLDNVAVLGNCIPTPTVTISGDAGVASATLSYTDGTPKTVTAAAGPCPCLYTITVPSGWTGTVTPSLSNYTFAPSSIPYANVTRDKPNQDYVATAVPVNCLIAPTPGPFSQRSVLINEVGWGGTTASYSDGWLELKNTTACPLSLSGWSLKAVSNGGYTVFNIVFSAPDVIPGDTSSTDPYFLIVRNDGTIPNRPQNKIAPGLNLVTYGELLFLYGPNGEQVDTANIAYTSSSSTVGAVGPWPAGLSAGRASMERYGNIPDAPDAWVTYAGPLAPLPGAPEDRQSNVVNGTPGGPNWATTVTITPSPLPTKYRRPTPIPPTPFAHMVINEFLPRAGTDWNHDGAINVYDEFIELKNLGPISVNLSSWRLDDAANPLHSYTLPSMTLKTGERALFYHSTTNIPLEDSGGTVRLLNPSGIVFDARGYGPVGKPDVSHCRIPDGYYWQDACFPTPGTENSLTGSAASPPPIAAVLPPPCLLPDTAPLAFRVGECAPYGSDIWDRTYWDDPAGSLEFLIQDLFSKWKTIVQ